LGFSSCGARGFTLLHVVHGPPLDTQRRRKLPHSKSV
jgi:hypothetical protein